ncbi:MAG TPA: hypothetical protein VMV43_01165 [Candidatus Nanopelagicaceae bacterium]|nr:hypothetical protein [Candidatus Nanopelagicaceae bacterium]
MPKISQNIEINTNLEKVYKILTDGEQTVKWNPIVNDITTLEENKYILKSTIGDLIINKIEKVKDVYVKWRMEQSDLHSMGYILEEKLPISKVALWVEFENKKFKKQFKEAANLTLEGLKKYIDYIEAGGNILEYKKQ